MAELYLIANGAAPTTAALVVATTGTVIKTMLQVKLGSTLLTPRAKVVAWGISFDGAADAAKIKCELITTNTIAATVAAHAASGIVNLDPLGVTPTDGFPFQLTTTTTGFTATAEGTITGVTRMLDLQLVSPAGGYAIQFPLGREPMIQVSEYLRIRVTAAAAVNAYCYAIIEI